MKSLVALWVAEEVGTFDCSHRLKEAKLSTMKPRSEMAYAVEKIPPSVQKAERL